MKRYFIPGAAVLVSILLVLFFGSQFIRYLLPVGDVSYDLSLQTPDGFAPETEEYDMKGWTVFTQEGEQAAALISENTGLFYGDVEPCQTFYYSRVLTEKLTRPTLRLDAGEASLAVFLDTELLYSDFVLENPRIGYLALPDLGRQRNMPILLELPQDYQGRTLTIAQNAGYNEKPGMRFDVYPKPVTLYSGYAAEKNLISESFRVAIPAGLFFFAGSMLLVMFALEACRGRWRWTLLLAAVMVLLWALSTVSNASFRDIYNRHMALDIADACRVFSVSLLLTFFACRAERLRIVALTIAGLSMLSSLARLYIDWQYEVFTPDMISYLYETPFTYVSFAGLLVMLAGGWLFWRKESLFYRLFAPLFAAGAVLTAGYLAVFQRDLFFSQLQIAVSDGGIQYFLWKLAAVAMVSAVISLSLELAEREIASRMEVKQLARHNAAALESYENLRRQYEDVMILRHDFLKHMTVLRQMSEAPSQAAYLDELIGQNEKIPDLIQSGNQMMDIILNSKLTAARYKGIDVRLLRVNAPEKLPLTDADLCSLTMNLLDNAVNAASDPALTDAYISLDMHVKGKYFLFTLENATGEETKKTVPGHGFGLKIVRMIMNRQEENLMKTQWDNGVYKVTLGIFLG